MGCRGRGRDGWVWKIKGRGCGRDGRMWTNGDGDGGGGTFLFGRRFSWYHRVRGMVERMEGV